MPIDTVERVPVPAETRAPDGTTAAYVLGSDDALLVDPAGRSDDLDRAVEAADVAHVAVTHTHPDHVGGVVAYADRTGATVWAHADHAERFSKATGVDPDRRFVDGDRLPPDGAVEVVATPGHAPDHVAFALATDGPGESSDDVLVGDLAVAEGSVVVGAPEGDVGDYIASLRRIRDRDPAPDRLLPAHGPVIDDPGATLDRLIDHRLERERKVLAAVEAGHRDPDAITDAAYEKDLSGVYDLARATVVAHLENLADEGRVTFDGDRARPV